MADRPTRLSLPDAGASGVCRQTGGLIIINALSNSRAAVHGHGDEIKWNKIHDRNRKFYCDLVEEFFRRNWLMFHCLVGRKGYIDKSLHSGGYDEALRKHFTMLIRNKIQFFSAGDKGKAYHIVVDKLPSSYDKADEAAHVIVDHTLKKQMGFTPVHNLVTRDSKDALGIQVADVLLGAVVTDWNHETAGPSKLALRDWVAEHLGWRNLRADTRRREWKFNIWYFHADGEAKPREATTWELNLKHKVPPYRPKRR